MQRSIWLFLLVPSQLPGYSYDIFISYRQKDNKAGRWVSEFVHALKGELESTIKEDISIFFDENHGDGLLETHQVNKSLDEKLHCLLFIPIVSQTYCDPKSYAWQFEFLPFLRRGSADALGLDIRLPSGNIGSRVLPVMIHSLEPSDRMLIEKEIGHLRGVEFVFQKPGINRPLLPGDLAENHSLRTNYRDQLNKLANSIRESLDGLTKPRPTVERTPVPTRSASTAAPTIAVLPFVNMSNDPEQDYFSDGISEEIINLLVQVPELQVTGRTSSFSFKGRNDDLRRIGETLGVRFILEGSLRKSGNRIRITAQLIEAASGFHRWSQKFDRELKDVFDIQDEIAASIVQQLQATLSFPETKERRQTSNVEAYQWYLKGMSLFYQRGLALFEAIRCFQAALAMDPKYALAYAGLADVHTMLGFHGYMMPEEAWPVATAAADKALELGPDLAEAHCAKGTIELIFERNFDKAGAAYHKSLALNPQYVQGRVWYSLFYLQSVRLNGPLALDHGRRAISQDPLSAYAVSAFCPIASINGLFDEAVGCGIRAVSLDNRSFNAKYLLGCSYHWAGKFQEAIEILQKAIDDSGRHQWALCAMATTLADCGKVDKAKLIYQELLDKYKRDQVLPSVISTVAAATGDTEGALKFAHEAYARHDPYQVITLANWLDSRALRAVPGVDTLLKKIGYGPGTIEDY